MEDRLKSPPMWTLKYTCNPSTLEAEPGLSQVPDQPGPQRSCLKKTPAIFSFYILLPVSQCTLTLFKERDYLLCADLRHAFEFIQYFFTTQSD